MKLFLLLFSLLFYNTVVMASQLAIEDSNPALSPIQSSSGNLNDLLTPATDQTLLEGDGETLLPVDQAFILSANVDQTKQITLEWLIAPGHYLYQKKFKFSLQGDGQLGTPVLPIGQTYDDPYFGPVTVYKENVVKIILPLTQSDNAESLIVEYQGCAEKGFCYPPVDKQISLIDPTNIVDVTEMINSLVPVTPPPTTDSVSPITTPSIQKEISTVSPIVLFIAACCLIIIAVYLGTFDAYTEQTTHWQKFKKGIGIILLIYGILLMIGFASGHVNLLKPL